MTGVFSNTAAIVDGVAAGMVFYNANKICGRIFGYVNEGIATATVCSEYNLSFTSHSGFNVFSSSSCSTISSGSGH